MSIFPSNYYNLSKIKCIKNPKNNPRSTSPRLDYKSNQDKIEKKIKTFGYDQVELDENGFRSGSLNKKAGIGK